MTRIAIALRLYAGDHGCLPVQLDGLVRAGYLTSLPVDPFTGGAIVYRPRAGLLYCLGPDRVDNGGDRSDDAVAYLPFVKKPPTPIRKPPATR